MNRQLYISWIREVRGKTNQTEFAGKIYHYKTIKNIRKCCTYHRNEIGNWEKGKNLPMNIEAFISIALLDFDQKYPRVEMDIAYRNRRYQYVNDKMMEIIGQNLYCRSVYDALLIQVCRGVISFEDVLELEKELEKMLHSVILNSEQKRKYALKKETDIIRGNLFKIETREEIVEVVEESKIFFCTGTRTLGERMKICFESRQRYVEKITLAEAVRIYAPNYRESFNRVFTSSGISRQWLIDICVHLRFTRKEIQYILDNAHHVSLSDDCNEQEAFYVDEGYPIGSTAWYKHMERQYPEEFEGHFYGFKRMTLSEKIIIGVLLCGYAEEIYDENGLLPADYLLESFLFYECGKGAVRKVEKILKSVSDNEEWNAEELQQKLNIDIVEWLEYIKSGMNYFETFAAMKVYEDYRQEFSDYFSVSVGKVVDVADTFEISKLKYIAAMLYTIFMGKYYLNTITERDLKYIKMQFENQTKDWKIMYNFISQFFITFLSDHPVYKNSSGRYYTIINKRKTGSFDLEETYISLWECLIML